jgi:hypothetical protein
MSRSNLNSTDAIYFRTQWFTTETISTEKFTIDKI